MWNTERKQKKMHLFPVFIAYTNRLMAYIIQALKQKLTSLKNNLGSLNLLKKFTILK